MHRKWIRLIPYAVRGMVSVGLVAAGLAVYGILVATSPEVPRREEYETGWGVEVAPAALVPIRRTWEGFGGARAMDFADVSAEVAGIVREIPDVVEAGAAVEAGDVIARLDDIDFRHEVAAAEHAVALLESQLQALEVEAGVLDDQLGLAQTNVQLARSAYERAQEAFDRGVANEIDVEQRQREFTAARQAYEQIRERVQLIPPRRRQLEATLGGERSRLELARRNLERTIIRSPLSGTIQRVDVEAGERVGPGDSIARIVSLRRIEVPLSFPASARPWLRVGDPVRIAGEGAAEAAWTARLARIAPEAEAGTRTFLAFAEVRQDPDATPLLVPGQFLRGVVESSEVQHRLVVPRRAVLNGQVLVVEDGKAQPRVVNVAHRFFGRIEGLADREREWAVLEEGSSLRPDELVILNHIDQLRPGSDVWITNAELLAGDGRDEGAADSTGEGG